MSKINKIKLSGTTYELQDLRATSVVSLTQAEYDILPSSAKTANILYNITDAQGGDLSQYWTSAQTQSAITQATSGKADTSYVDQSVSGKVDNSVYTAYTATTDTAIQGKQDTLTAGTGIDITNNVISVTGGSGGGISSAECQTMIDQSISGKVDNSVYTAYTSATDTALSNKVSTSAVTSAVTSGSTDVLTSGGAYEQFGGMKLLKLTQSAYDNLPVKDSMTVYIITDA